MQPVVKMSDVALLAGVSVSTVSHVINGTRFVAPATAAAVQKALEATGYRHNLAARALATQTTDTIGLVTAVTANPHFADLAAWIENGAHDKGYSLLLANTGDDAERLSGVIEHLLERRVTGMLVAPVLGNDDLDAQLQALSDSGYPLVLIDRRSHLAIDQVFSDSSAAIDEAVHHLYQLGHRRIGFVAGEAYSMAAVDRLTGYRKATRALGLEAVVLEADSNEQLAYRAILQHFDQHDDQQLDAAQPSTALVVANNLMTAGVVRGLQQLGLRIPDDVAIECYDDMPWADLLESPLSTAAQNTQELARRALELLTERIDGTERQPERVIVPTMRRHRHSCGCQ